MPVASGCGGKCHEVTAERAGCPRDAGPISLSCRTEGSRTSHHGVSEHHLYNIGFYCWRLAACKCTYYVTIRDNVISGMLDTIRTSTWVAPELRVCSLADNQPAHTYFPRRQGRGAAHRRIIVLLRVPRRPDERQGGVIGKGNKSACASAQNASTTPQWARTF